MIKIDANLNEQVIIRLRPLNSSEMSLQGQNRCVRQESSQTITWTGHPESRFTFDVVADENVTQVLFLFHTEYLFTFYFIMFSG